MGAARNLANVVLKRLSACNDKPTSQSIPPRRPTRSKHQNNDDSHLATAITNKLEAGSFRAAIRLLCSEDKPALNNTETLETLRAKHPPAAQDRKQAYDFVSNTRFQPLHRKTLLNALGLSLQAHLADRMASLHSIHSSQSTGREAQDCSHRLHERRFKWRVANASLRNCHR